MHMTTVRDFALLSLVFILSSGCGNSESDESAPSPSTPAPTESAEAPGSESAETPPASAEGAAATAPPAAAPANVETGGELTVNYDFIGMENATVTLGDALAYVEDDRIRLELVSKGIGNVECDRNWDGGHGIPTGELVVKVDTRDASTPFARAAGTFQHFGYTYYYRREGRDEGTNSGNSGRPDLDTEVEITAIDASSVRGRLRIRNQVQGTFTAKVCP